MEWKTINIFISSTFNDMHAERDYIRKYLVPRLNARLAEYRVSVQATDLRWGISTTGSDEEEREAKVLHVCMNAIREAKPYFIALIGARYGWIPSESRMENVKKILSPAQARILEEAGKQLSVTEMEILLGALGDKEYFAHSFFCMRGDEAYRDIPEEVRDGYFDYEGSRGHERLEKLKTKIERACEDNKDSMKLIRYTPSWDNANQRLEGFEQLGDQLFDTLYNDIVSDLGQTVTDTDQEDALLRNFISANMSDFTGRRYVVDPLVDFILSYRDARGALSRSNGIFLSGFSGCGKSYVFSALCSRLQETASREGNIFLLSHAAGISQKSISSLEMLIRWNRLMLNYLGEDTDKTNNAGEAKNLFTRLIMRMQARGVLPVVLIDALDTFSSDRLRLIRDFKFIPYNVPVVCTTLPGYADGIVRMNPRFSIRDIDLFSREEALELIESRMRSNVKELTPDQIESILSKKTPDGLPSYTSPLWLQMCISLLLELGSEDFREIHRQNFKEEDKKIEYYLQNIIDHLPGTAELLFKDYLERTTEFFNPALTLDSLSLIAMTNDGVDDETLSAILGEEWDQLEFTSIQNWLRGFVRRNSQTGKWMLTHNILKGVAKRMNSDRMEDLKRAFDTLISQRVWSVKCMLIE